MSGLAASSSKQQQDQANGMSRTEDELCAASVLAGVLSIENVKKSESGGEAGLGKRAEPEEEDMEEDADEAERRSSCGSSGSGRSSSNSTSSCTSKENRSRKESNSGSDYDDFDEDNEEDDDQDNGKQTTGDCLRVSLDAYSFVDFLSLFLF